MEKDKARGRLWQLPSIVEEDISSDEWLEEEPLPWKIPNREERDLILAEEILRFASTTNRPSTSRNTTEFQLIHSTGDTSSEDIKLSLHTTATITSTDSAPMPVASAIGTSGSEPLDSASFITQPSAPNFQDTYIPLGGAGDPIDQLESLPIRSPQFKLNIIPVTNRILAAIARLEEAACPASGSLNTLEPISSVEMKEFWPKSNAELYQYFLENLKRMQGSDLSSASTSYSSVSTRHSQSEPMPNNDEISKLKRQILEINRSEDKITKELQNEQEKSDVEMHVDSQQSNKQTQPNEVTPNQNIPNVDVDNIYNQPTIPAPDFKNVQEDYNSLNNNPKHINAEYFQEVDYNEVAASEFPDLEDYFLQPEWSKQEKQRLFKVMKDMSRQIKTKALQSKRENLLKKGRMIAQAIKTKICGYNKQILGVNRQSLSEVAFPLDQVEEYDWEKVANAVNAKRTAEDCRKIWKYSLHPKINTREWSPDEIKSMEIIARRHHCRNWNLIAKLLNTGRIGVQCYLRHRKYLRGHSVLHG